MIEIGDTLGADALGILVTDDAGALADATTAVLTITLPDGATVTPAITHPATGTYYPAYVATVAGLHTWRWELTGITGGAASEAAEGSFVVAASPPSAAQWCTLELVTQVTGHMVTADQLVQAEAIIAMSAGRDPVTTPAAVLSTRDAYWLARAVAYQAAWLAAQPDLFTRSGVTEINQDGQQVKFTPTGQTLAPLARKALARVSWKGTQSVHVLAPIELAAVGPALGSEIRDYDDGGAWLESWAAL